jgi:hypothetical protein
VAPKRQSDRLPRLSRGLTALPILVVLLGGAPGCRKSLPQAIEIQSSWTVTPPQPIVGADVTADLILAGENGQSLSGAVIQFEGHMDHPGMAPVIAQAQDMRNGHYSGTMRLTMAGNWTLIATGQLPGGIRFHRPLGVLSARLADSP